MLLLLLLLDRKPDHLVKRQSTAILRDWDGFETPRDYNGSDKSNRKFELDRGNDKAFHFGKQLGLDIEDPWCILGPY
jgi:hypothetical protein